MKHWMIPANANAWIGWTVAAIVVAAVFPLSASGADRLVVSELFTGEG
ncbi:MAG TPA: hypothetical protein VM243_14240 [Phycisphaerae bacterium]|nr:hypothetical protein [Phycisphaerae bacterium]